MLVRLPTAEEIEIIKEEGNYRENIVVCESDRDAQIFAEDAEGNQLFAPIDECMDTLVLYEGWEEVCKRLNIQISFSF